MPRDVNGLYTLPSGNPVVTGTTIASTWANTTLNDLATAVSNSLDRTGASVGMTGQLKVIDGSVATPGISWNSEPASGFYRAGAGDFRFSVSGTDKLQFSSSGLGLPNGAVGTPALYFTGDPNTGIYWIGADDLAISTGGVKRLEININGSIIFSAPGASAGHLINVNQVNGGMQILGANTGAGYNLAFYDSTAGSFRGFIGLGTNTVGGAAVTDFVISPGPGGSLVIGNANGVAIATRFGPNGNVTINTPTSGVPLTVNNSANAYIQSWVSGGVTGGVFMSSVAPNVQFGTQSNHGFGIFTNNGSSVFLVPAGGLPQVTDSVGGTTGFDIGYKIAPQNAQAGNYTLVLTDNAKSVQFNGAGPYTATIPANASVAYPLGSIIIIVNNTGSNLTVSSADSLYLAGTGTVGSRTVASNGIITLYKFVATGWFTSGPGVS